MSFADWAIGLGVPLLQTGAGVGEGQMLAQENYGRQLENAQRSQELQNQLKQQLFLEEQIRKGKLPPMAQFFPQEWLKWYFSRAQAKDEADRLRMEALRWKPRLGPDGKTMIGDANRYNQLIMDASLIEAGYTPGEGASLSGATAKPPDPLLRLGRTALVNKGAIDAEAKNADIDLFNQYHPDRPKPHFPVPPVLSYDTPATPGFNVPDYPGMGGPETESAPPTAPPAAGAPSTPVISGPVGPWAGVTSSMPKGKINEGPLPEGMTVEKFAAMPLSEEDAYMNRNRKALEAMAANYASVPARKLGAPPYAGDAYSPMAVPPPTAKHPEYYGEPPPATPTATPTPTMGHGATGDWGSTPTPTPTPSSMMTPTAPTFPPGPGAPAAVATPLSIGSWTPPPVAVPLFGGKVPNVYGDLEKSMGPPAGGGTYEMIDPHTNTNPPLKDTIRTAEYVVLKDPHLERDVKNIPHTLLARETTEKLHEIAASMGGKSDIAKEAAGLIKMREKYKPNAKEYNYLQIMAATRKSAAEVVRAATNLKNVYPNATPWEYITHAHLYLGIPTIEPGTNPEGVPIPHFYKLETDPVWQQYYTAVGDFYNKLSQASLLAGKGGLGLVTLIQAHFPRGAERAGYFLPPSVPDMPEQVIEKANQLILDPTWSSLSALEGLIQAKLRFFEGPGGPSEGMFPAPMTPQPTPTVSPRQREIMRGYGMDV